jgi:hypothetical protein
MLKTSAVSNTGIPTFLSLCLKQLGADRREIGVRGVVRRDSLEIGSASCGGERKLRWNGRTTEDCDILKARGEI